MTHCNPEIKRGYYWIFLLDKWQPLRYNGKWYTTNERLNNAICDAVKDCVVVPIAEPVFIDTKIK
jgi:hypothetical protein